MLNSCKLLHFYCFRLRGVYKLRQVVGGGREERRVGSYYFYSETCLSTLLRYSLHSFYSFHIFTFIYFKNLFSENFILYYYYLLNQWNVYILNPYLILNLIILLLFFYFTFPCHPSIAVTDRPCFNGYRTNGCFW